MADKYILPNSNTGVIYPSWVPYTYKKYKVNKIKHDPNVDLCKVVKKTTGELTARPYQEFIQKYMRFESPFKSILLYHGLGVGKTATSIYVYNILYDRTKNWNVYIMVKKSLFKGWLDELNTFLSKKDFKDRLNNIHFINYDSPNANIQFKQVLQDKTNVGKFNLFIIDEVHNFIRNVYSNITNQRSIRALEPYEFIKHALKTTKETRIICISGTPVINKPYELALLFNLLRPDSFPNKEDEFNTIFLKNMYSKEINPDTKNLFQRRILGLVSYYDYFHPGLYATTEHFKIEITMSSHQENIYGYFEEIEEKLEKQKARFRKSATRNQSDMFKAYTRQACNFVFPYISKEINGESRPRPSVYRKSLKSIENDVHNFEHNQSDNKNKKVNQVLKLYKAACKKYINAVTKLWDTLQQKDSKKNINFKNIINILQEKYIDDIHSFMIYYKSKSELFRSMYNCSSKILYMCLNIMLIPGNALVYTNYVSMEGLEIIKIYFKYFGITKYGEYHGGIIDRTEREKTRSIFNNTKNKYGDIMNVILISPAMTEGVNLSNVRQVHIMEPHWNRVRIKQVIGRAIRQCSHQDLPLKERDVRIYQYFMKRNNEKPTTDQIILDISTTKYNLLDSFLQTIKEAAIDCELFKDVNQINNKYSCFKFNAENLLSKDLGHAYIKNIYDDQIKENKGSNSINYQTITVRTQKIKAVKWNNNTVNEYWYDNKTGYVFDIDVDVLIGQVKKDQNNLPEMKNIQTYIISNLSELDKYKLSKYLI